MKIMRKIIFLLLFYCVLFSVDCKMAFSATLLDRVVATVNNEIITWSELRTKIEIDGRKLLADLPDKERSKQMGEIERIFLNSMIDHKLQLQEARNRGLDVSSSEAENAINDIKKKYNLTDEGFIESLKAEGFTNDQYKAQLKEQILLSKIVRYEVNESILIPDQRINEYYEANKEQYREKETIRISQIFFPGNRENASEKADLEAKAEKIMQRIKRGEAFAKAVSKLAGDAGSEFAGDLGYMKRGSMLKEIEDAAFSLKEGEVSSPFWGPGGLRIIKLEDILKGSEIDEVRQEIKEILFQKAFKLKYEEWVKMLREKAYIEIKL